MCNYIAIHRLWPMVCLDGQEWEGKLVTKKFGEEICEQTPSNVKENEDICIPCKYSPKSDLSKGEFQ